MESIFNLTNSEGVRTGGIFQFLRSMTMEMRNTPGYYPIVTWDAGLAPRRLAVYPNYKHHADRLIESAELKQLGVETVEEDEYLKEYHNQRAQLIEILHQLGIPSLRFDSWEGDDLLYILSKFTDDGVVLTDDRDLIQLMSPTISIARPLADEFLIYDEWQKEHNDPGMRKYVIAKSIVGDGSDNIPKCAQGVGGKTAEYIAELMVNDPDGWLDQLKNSTRKAHKSFASDESIKQFQINMELIDLSRVEITDEIVNLVTAEVLNNIHSPFYFGVVGKLGALEITKLDTDNLISMLTSMYAQGGIICPD